MKFTIKQNLSVVEVRITWRVLTRRGWQPGGGTAWTPPAREDFSSAAGSADCEKLQLSVASAAENCFVPAHTLPETVHIQ